MEVKRKDLEELLEIAESDTLCAEARTQIGRKLKQLLDKEKLWKSLMIDCEDCGSKGEVQLGEGVQKGICPTCEGKGELEIPKSDLEVIKEYLEWREKTIGTHWDALADMAQERGKDLDSRQEAHKEIMEIIHRISIANVPELRQFMRERLAET